MSNRTRFIAISGGIAVGKTELGIQLSKTLPNCQHFQEYPDENPYLVDFYKNMEMWGFHSRIGMLALFAKRFSQIDGTKKYILFDRCIQELITFAELHHDKGNMTDREFNVYTWLYDSYVHLLPNIDLFIYLHCSPHEALRRIELRSRDFEKGVKEEYLLTVEYYYDRWFEEKSGKQKLIKINTDQEIDVAKLSTKIIEMLSD